jgi:hypothetical protein
MRRRFHLARIVLWLGLLAGWAAATASPAADAPKANPPPLLVVEEEAPLLLEEVSTNGTNAAALQAQQDASINAKCYVCHVNFRHDPFVQWHLSTNIGCVRCHGESREHVADEANLTPPDIMYWPSRVGFSCYFCHPRHDVPAREVLARWRECCRDVSDPKRVLCTQCHGAHRMQARTIVWDKRTGALISKIKSASTTSPSRAAPPPSDGQTATAPGAQALPLPKTLSN